MFYRFVRRVLRATFSDSSPQNRPSDKPRPKPKSPFAPTSAPVQKPARPAPQLTKGETLKGKCYVIDGDTIVINKVHIRLFGIDAPEMDQPWGVKSKFAMVALCKGQIVTAHIQDHSSFDRVVAKCVLPDGTDLSAALVTQGLALDWAKFSGGAYRHLEPEGIRKKLWRVSAKHQGRFKP